MEKSVEKKKNLVKKLVNAGINATPSVVDFVMTMPNPSESLEFIIKETSFIPTFKSHLTLEIVDKISNDEIQKALKR
ncbi:MAG: hypothetical protein GF311_18125, partial [Candidatus Lokiarchaeota archaeon]|nr:hypothetical protein [Candidatus Lokiarchaeota archaeon]